MKNQSLLGSDLLGILDDEDRALIMPHLEELRLGAGRIIYEPGSVVDHAYFPRHDALVAFLIPMADGETVEVAMTGREGAIGGIVSQGHLPAYARACVHHGGDFFRMPVSKLEEIKDRSRKIGALFNRYADYMVAQLFQSIACNARHSVEQRAARWLCAAVSRTGRHEVALTQAQLGGFLGVGRPYVTRVVARLKQEGILDTRRGAIIVNKPKKLGALSCDCSTLAAEHYGLVMEHL
ncbi:MAG TPA: Crp/Fnr family transcriptional regulator [Sphingobium sp.]